MSSFALARNLLHGQGRRYLATGLAVLLGVAFLATTLLLGDSLKATVTGQAAGDLDRYAAVVEPGDSVSDGLLTPADLAKMKAAPGVASVTTTRVDSMEVLRAGSHDSVMAANAPADAAAPTSGRWPQSAGEVTLSSDAASRLDLAVGGTLKIAAPEGKSGTLAASVVGVADDAPAGSAAAQATGMPVAYGTDDALAAWTGRPGASSARLLGAAGSDPQAVRDAVAPLAPKGWTVRTGPEAADAAAKQAAGGTDLLTNMLLVFTVVALFVCALVIANTFTIVLAQRSRQLALLRCIGAQRGQVFGSVVLESLAVGLLSSLLGVGLALAATWALVRVAASSSAKSMLSTMAVTPVAIVVPLLVGTGLCVLAALLPARRATRVAPLAALRPDVPTVGRRAGVGPVRLVFGILFAAAGFAALVYGALRQNLILGIAGGVVSFLGVLMLAVVLVAAALRLCRAPAGRLAGVPGKLAVDNAGRNPRRAAATCSALLVGVTLIVMMAVGAQTGRDVADHELSSHYPLDVAVATREKALPQAAIDRVAHAEGVAASAPVRGAQVQVGGADTTVAQDVVGVDPAAVRPVLRDPAQVPELTAGTAAVSTDQAASLGVKDGGRITIAKKPFTVRVGAYAAPVMVTPADLAAIAPSAAVHSVWVRLDDAADPSAALTSLQAAVSDVPDVTVAGAAPQRVQFNQIVDTVLLVVVALLGVAVVIALVGVGNTLGLSVLERTRESALLRALGLTRGQLRLTLAVEAALLALVGVVLGSALGVLYGWAGIHALLGTYAEHTALAVPWGRIGLAALVAIGAALLASVLPARRATRVAPAEALAVGE